MHPTFKNVGKATGLEIWRIEVKTMNKVAIFLLFGDLTSWNFEISYFISLFYFY